jgi:hypothetical protein
MKAIADANPDLAGVLPQGYAGLPNDVLQELLRLLAPLKIDGDAVDRRISDPTENVSNFKITRPGRVFQANT